MNRQLRGGCKPRGGPTANEPAYPLIHNADLFHSRCSIVVSVLRPGRRPTTTAEIGCVLAAVSGTNATYDFDGDELYVRALVTSDAPHPNPTIPGETKKAWTQPVLPS